MKVEASDPNLAQNWEFFTCITLKRTKGVILSAYEQVSGYPSIESPQTKLGSIPTTGTKY